MASVYSCVYKCLYVYRLWLSWLVWFRLVSLLLVIGLFIPSGINRLFHTGSQIKGSKSKTSPEIRARLIYGELCKQTRRLDLFIRRVSVHRHILGLPLPNEIPSSNMIIIWNVLVFEPIGKENDLSNWFLILLISIYSN